MSTIDTESHETLIGELEAAVRSGSDEVIRNVESVSATIASAIGEQNAVTSEISRTVEQTSEAAREVAEQIVSVSRKAVETGQCALEIRDNSAEIAGKIESLSTILVRVIRTSTSEVDRRRSTRIVLQRFGTLTINGNDSRVTVRDVSPGGAMVDGFRTAAPINGLASLSIDGFPEHFAGYIARVRRCGSSQIRAHRSAARSARSIETFQRGRVIERAKGKRGSCRIIQPAFAEANSPQGPRIANYLTGERRRPRPRRLIASAISPIASSTNPATLASLKAGYSGRAVYVIRLQRSASASLAG